MLCSGSYDSKMAEVNSLLMWIVLYCVAATTIAEHLAQTDPHPATTEDFTNDEIETKESQLFLDKLFEKYGDSGEMTFEGFEHLLANLGLGNVKIKDHDVNDHYPQYGGFEEFHPHHNHSELSGDDESRVRRSALIAIRSVEAAKYNACLGPGELLRAFTISSSISANNFLHVCPAIIYQLDEHTCDRGATGDASRAPSSGDLYELHKQQSHNDTTRNDTTRNDTTRHGSLFRNISTTTWLYSMAAVFIISAVGFLCVGIIPVLEKLQARMYKSLLQFLIALAIGTLTGDALLHLIPHAMMPHNTDASAQQSADHNHTGSAPHSHRQPVFIGVCVLLGIYLFFLMERLVASVTHCKEQRKRRVREEVVKEPRYAFIGERLSWQGSKQASAASLKIETADRRTHEKQDSPHCMEECEPMNTHSDTGNSEHDCTTAQSHGNTNHSNTQQHQRSDHHHGDDVHGNHGHSHALPGNDMSSIVWMVIMGDGFHNFCDGLAIGAAFASSMTGGFSTSVAVFCHELPHEIGDFAVLLNAGMPIRQALFYNVVSSVLCFCGLILGLIIGNFSSATPWIFAITAGMFIYISLADMLPELSSHGRNAKETATGCHLLLQCAGIMAGIAIMFTIAMYEDKLTQLLDRHA